MFVVIFIIIFNIFNLYAKSFDFNNEPICVTEICNNTAIKMKGLMNLNIDPCTDFYQYACGNWPKNADDSLFSSLQKEINHKLAEIVRSVPSSEKKTPLAKTKTFYESCINTDKIESEGVSDLLKIIDKNGGWPMIMSENDWRSKKKSWKKVDLAYRKITNHSPIFSLNVMDLMTEILPPLISLNSPLKDYNKYFPSRNISELDIFMASLEVINYMNVIKNISHIIARYRNYSLSEEILEDDVNNIVKFEWELDQIVRNLTKNFRPGDDNQQILSINDFQKNYSLVCCKTKNSKIDWLYMINQYFDNVSNIHVDGSEKIMVKLNFFLQLSDLLDRTPSRVIVNTIHWNFVNILGPHTSKEMIILFKKLLSIPTNPFNLTTRHEICTEIVRINMPHALAYSYIKNFFSKEAKNLNKNLVSEIASVMESLLKNSSRIRNHMKQELSTKIKNLKQAIAYPDWYENKTEVDHYYDDIIMSDSYFNNIISIKKFKFILELKSFRDRSIRKKYWITPPTHVNAYYLPWINSIFLPAGIIQRPYFDHQQLDALNYGGIGTTIGHELAHMINIFKNSFINKDNIKSKSIDTIKLEFWENIECIIFEFSNYTLELNNRTYKVNPYRTLEENFADTVGILVAYKAFQTHMIKKKKTKIRLPGFEHLGSNQLFFLSYAQTECGSQRHKKLIEDFNDFHSPAMFRVIGSLSNNEHFAEAFQCAKGTKMNPTNKCSFL